MSRLKELRKFVRESNGIVEFETTPETQPPMEHQWGLMLVSIFGAPLVICLIIYAVGYLYV